MRRENKSLYPLETARLKIKHLCPLNYVRTLENESYAQSYTLNILAKIHRGNRLQGMDRDFANWITQTICPDSSGYVERQVYRQQLVP